MDKEVSDLSNEAKSEVVTVDGKLVPSISKAALSPTPQDKRIQTRAWWGIKPFLKVTASGK